MFCLSFVKKWTLFCKETCLPKMIEIHDYVGFFLFNRREGVTFSNTFLYEIIFSRNLKVLMTNLKLRNSSNF